MAPSTLLLSSASKPFLFSEITYSYFFSLKIPLTVKIKKKKKKKIIDQILGYISFYFEILAHLGHLFA